MGRLLFFALLVLAIYLIVRSMLPAPKDQSEAEKLASQQLQPCAHCGIYVSDADAVRSRGKTYCGEEHRDADSGHTPDRG